MRAFSTAWRAMVGVYNELFFLLGMNLLWWVTGGVFVGLAGILILVPGTGLPLWLIPLVAIPAGPATAALANVTRQVARERHVDRSFYWDGLQSYWRPALILNAASLALLALLLLNLQFYAAQAGTWLEILAILWFYLVVLGLGIVLYTMPVLVGLKETSVWNALRIAGGLAFANPLYTGLLAIIAVLLTVLCAVIVILLPLVWPALMMLLGECSLMLFMERLGPGNSEETHDPASEG